MLRLEMIMIEGRKIRWSKSHLDDISYFFYFKTISICLMDNFTPLCCINSKALFGK